jgi:transketolase
VIYVFTHDSIGLGEDGPTHQPIETLAALRAIPGLVVIRPADSAETVEAWRAAILQRGPVALALTRQKVAFLDRSRHQPTDGLARGAYILSDATAGAPQIVLMASGSEVQIAAEAQSRLENDGVRVRLVSAPSLELFAQQPQSYRRLVLPHDVPRIALEAASPMSWYRWVGERGAILGLERFGASAPYERIYEGLGLTPERVVEEARTLLGR